MEKRQARSRLIRSVALVLIAAAAIGVFFYLRSASKESTDDAFVEGHVVTVSPRVSGHVSRVLVTDNQQVKAGDVLVELDPRDYKARLDAAQAALDGALASGRSLALDVTLTTVSTTSDLDSAKADVSAAQAVVESARAAVSATESGQEEARAQAVSARANLEQAKADKAAAEALHGRDLADLKRAEEMVAAGLANRQQLDHARAAEETSRAALTAAEQGIKTREAMIRQAEAAIQAARDNRSQALSQLETRRAQLAQTRARLDAARSAPERVASSRSKETASQAAVEKARAEVEQARLSLSYTKITAPADGFITKKAVETGAFVQAGQALMALVRPDVWVTANFKETQLTRMRPGQAVSVKADAYPGVTFKARVDSIQHGTGSRFSLLPAENATGNFVKVVQRVPVKIVFETEPRALGYLLSPGMSVVPTVNVAAKPAESGGYRP